MSTFICEGCGAVENTATSNYWVRQMYNESLLCSKCDPKIGKWHNMFEKKHWSEYGTEQEMKEMEKAGKGNIINATKYFESHRR